MQTTLLLIAAALLLVWLLLRRRGAARKGEAPQRPARSVDTTYHAVSIRVGETACSAAREMLGRRFLSCAAPRLPLADCDAAACDCRFVHHDDRRSGKDRRSPFAPACSAGDTGSFREERRDRSDRREDADTDLF